MFSVTVQRVYVRLCWVFYMVLSCHGQNTPPCPCSDVFMYELLGVEPERWYGVVKLSTDSLLYSLWVDIFLDRKAKSLVSWLGEVTTTDNTTFQIETRDVRIYPGYDTALRFCVHYDQFEKVPAIQAIRFNGREICNANSHLPVFAGFARPETNTIQIKDAWTTPVPLSNPNVLQIDSQSQSQHKDNPTVTKSQSHFTQRQPVRQLNEGNSDYFSSGIMQIVVEEDNRFPLSRHGSEDTIFDSKQDICGKVVNTVNPIPLAVNGKSTLEKQWPWHIALYQNQMVDPVYLCGDSIISDEHIITAAHCVTRRTTNIVVNKNTLTVHLGKDNLKLYTDGVQVRFVAEIIVHPSYDGNTLQNDLSVLKLLESVQFTDWVQPVCLWPNSWEDLRYVVGKIGSVVGWGYDDKGIETEQLMLVEMPVVDRITCHDSKKEFFPLHTWDTTYCAGYRNGTSVCGGDSGGGMVFNVKETWYLRGLVSLAVARTGDGGLGCDTSHYVIFTDLAKYLPWLNNITLSL